MLHNDNNNINHRSRLYTVLQEAEHLTDAVYLERL